MEPIVISLTAGLTVFAIFMVASAWVRWHQRLRSMERVDVLKTLVTESSIETVEPEPVPPPAPAPPAVEDVEAAPKLADLFRRERKREPAPEPVAMPVISPAPLVTPVAPVVSFTLPFVVKVPDAANPNQTRVSFERRGSL